MSEDYTIIIRQNTTGKSASIRFASTPLINQDGSIDSTLLLARIGNLVSTLLAPEAQQIQLKDIEYKIEALLEQKRLICKDAKKDCGCGEKKKT